MCSLRIALLQRILTQPFLPRVQSLHVPQLLITQSPGGRASMVIKERLLAALSFAYPAVTKGDKARGYKPWI